MDGPRHAAGPSNRASGRIALKSGRLAGRWFLAGGQRDEGDLAAGFDLLDADHDALHRAIGDIADAANAFLGEIRAGGGDPLGALARLDEVRARTSAGLLGHLDDEEDLVIPIILDRGEEAL